VLLPCLGLAAAGLMLLSLARTRPLLILAAVVFGAGFGNMYPAFVAHVVKHVDPSRRGAAFGGILAAFDTGIGTGSIAIGAIAEHIGFAAAYFTAGLVASLSIPIFIWTEGRFLRPRV
jgi:predicted MFS family arabinose efflux permease